MTTTSIPRNQGEPEMPVHLRLATPRDWPVLQRIRLSVRENRLSDPGRITEQDYVTHLRDLGRGWVAESDAGIVGFGIVRRSDGNVWALFVDPRFEGHGVGGLLHDAMMAWVFEQGVAEAWLTTDRGTRAEAFYRRRGWVEQGSHGETEVRLLLRPDLLCTPDREWHA